MGFLEQWRGLADGFGERADEGGGSDGKPIRLRGFVLRLA